MNLKKRGCATRNFNHCAAIRLPRFLTDLFFRKYDCSMCGLAGFWSHPPQAPADIPTALQRMIDTLHHRGPDGDGVWNDAAIGVGLGHKRLAIQDTTSAGQQPMVSQSGRTVISYNGELYGLDSLKNELRHAGIPLRGHSDTEVLLEACELLGLPQTLQRIQGMYAFALWDRRTSQLNLVRDPLGIKPLYYGWRDGVFLFGSELRSVQSFPGFQRRQEPRAVHEFLKVGYIPAPLSIETGIFKLLPGHRLELNQPDETPEPIAFWNLIEDAYQSGVPGIGPADQPVDQLEQLLTEVVDQHMISDVPLGAFLSGGIDSSLVVALMQKQRTSPVQTFSIGFDVAQYNEADFAQQVADHLKTDHHQWIVTSKDAQEVIPRIYDIYDEPFADSSQIPTYLVSQFARQNVTVTLSGDGGDEFFGGYRRYPYFHHLWQRLTRLPRSLRRFAGQLLNFAVPVAPPSRRDGIRWRSQLLAIDSFLACYEKINRHWKFPVDLLTRDYFDTIENPTRQNDLAPYCMLPAGFTSRFDSDNSDDQFDWMMLHDALRYLPDDILTKVDRASMACSLETRVPLLDRRVVEFSWQLERSLKQGKRPTDAQQTGKVILREVLGRFVPRDLFERPKVGFGVPLDHWLRGDLRDWAEDLLDEKRLRQQGVFQVAPLRRVWESHRDGLSDQQYLLWDVLMFQQYNAT